MHYTSGYTLLQFTEPDTPKNLTAVARACNKLELMWSKPDNIGGLPIVNYEVKYGIKSGKGMSMTKNTSDTSIYLTDLIPKTMYTVQVRATTPLASNFFTTNTTTLHRSKTS